jgi:endonuclease/exonuclease/phosphatase family metal-dependent hydrolase
VRLEVAAMPVFPPIPEPLAAYAAQFDDLFTRANQRDGFRQYLAGLLLPAERNKTLTALANTEPVVGAHAPAAQRLQWFLSESTWEATAVTTRRLEVLRADPGTAPHAGGVLIIDETGDRKDGDKTAHVGRQYLGNRGKIENGVVSVSSLWADERLYYPLAVEPYTPQHWFAAGKADPAFRTKPQIALALVDQAVAQDWPLRTVVADSLYGEHHGFTAGLTQRGVPYVVALKPSHAWWAPVEAIGAVWEVAAAGAWQSPAQSGAWQAVVRVFRDGHAETWWAMEGSAGPYGPDRPRRLIIATPDPATLPETATWYLATTLPAAEADVAEIVRLYGLRQWVEQAYKQVKGSLGWSQYQVRSDGAMRRHWALVQCAFAFCWWAETRTPPAARAPDRGAETGPAPAHAQERGGKGPARDGSPVAAAMALLAAGAAASIGEIVARSPDIVALQEVSLLRRQSPGDLIVGGTVEATTVELDYLQILLAALHRYGGHYAVVSQVQNTDVELPLATGPFTFDDVRLTDRDVILARTDLPPGQLRTSTPLNANFSAGLTLPTGLRILRGWCSIDVQMRGRSFRVINTHLEDQLPEFLGDVQGNQARALLDGPANVDAPVVLLGDFNSDANGNYGPTVYPLLTGDGHFTDAWSDARPNEPGLTWGHDEFLSNKNHPFTLRIDLALFRGEGLDADGVVVADPLIRSEAPLWFSDHVALFATIRIH